MKHFTIEEYLRLQEFLDRYYPGVVELDEDIMVQYGDWYMGEMEE